MNPSLFNLCSLEAALWRRFLWEFKRESSTCHQVRQFSTKANPTIDAIAMRTAFTVRCLGSTLNMATRVIPAIMQPKTKRKMTKDGRQHVFFHFFLPVNTTDGFNNHLHSRCPENTHHYSDGIWQNRCCSVFISSRSPIHTHRYRRRKASLPCVSSVLNTRKSLVAKKPNSLSQASDRVAIISAIDVSPPTLDSRL